MHDYLVQVYIELADGGYSCASGCLLNHSLVLTTGHLVKGKMLAVDDEVGVYLPKREGQDAREDVDSKVVWVGEGELDAALLCLKEKQTWVATLDLGMIKKGEIQTLGWPENTTKEPSPEASYTYYDSTGKCTSEAKMDIKVDKKPVEASTWQGISGGPIFQQRSLCGLVRRRYEGFDSDMLTGVRVEDLQANSKFEAIRKQYGHVSAWSDTVLQGIRKHLHRDSEAKEIIDQSYENFIDELCDCQLGAIDDFINKLRDENENSDGKLNELINKSLTYLANKHFLLKKCDRLVMYSITAELGTTAPHKAFDCELTGNLFDQDFVASSADPDDWFRDFLKCIFANLKREVDDKKITQDMDKCIADISSLIAAFAKAKRRRLYCFIPEIKLPQQQDQDKVLGYLRAFERRCNGNLLLFREILNNPDEDFRDFEALIYSHLEEAAYVGN